MSRIAIVGMACRYPEAASPSELWENALTGRRAFRRLPSERLSLSDYWDADPATPDTFYADHAAVLEGYEFDRVGHAVAGSTFRSTDIAHWLALDVAGQALADAGFPRGEGLPRERTGVIVGNTLTGDQTRANQVRLRWPYVRRTVAAALRQQGWDDERLGTFLDDLEQTYKSPFPPINEDTLAGALANTIAGRICNHFDLNGGGYTVDGACSSSLLSVATACAALVNHDIDAAIAGGVDLSIDPFEIIGFAKTGALAKGEMRVYDRDSGGFWPGEGCGMVVLMREDEARAAGHRVYATIAGWGISSDGKGGITRPEARGYQMALSRAYERAGFGVETVAMFEGHGTGTAVGDTTELTALSDFRARAEASGPAAISSIKGMIGHTKAAAGVAGLIKATMAVSAEVLPPTIGCVNPSDVFRRDEPMLRALRKAEPWPSGMPVRAGITAMGFGGINTHIVVENPQPRGDSSFSPQTKALASSLQDVELLLVDAASVAELRARLTDLVDYVPRLAYGQIADLAATLHGDLSGLPYRAAAVVSSPADAERQLRDLIYALDAGETTHFTSNGRAALGHVDSEVAIGFLFPGQGSGRGMSGGALRRRFAEVEDVYLQAALPDTTDVIATAVAQPRIVTGSIAGLRALELLRIDASVAVGHSLGEISALHWAGAMDTETVLRVAGTRGRTMAEHSSSGTMASIGSSPEAVSELLGDLPVVIAGYNGPQQTVVSGSAEAIDEACRRALGVEISATRLSVSHAFHSPLVAPAADVFAEKLADVDFTPIERRIVSTVTGDSLAAGTDITGLLRAQITEPVLFSQAVTGAAKDVGLFVEVGPGRVLSTLASTVTDVPARALDTDSESLASLLGIVAAAYVLGAISAAPALFTDRAVRPLTVGAELRFLASPCETAPQLDLATTARPAAPAESDSGAAGPAGDMPAGSVVDLLRRIAAERAELPIEMVNQDSMLLDDLHLSSITVGQLVNQAAKELGISALQQPTNVATATVRELAESLETLAKTGASGPSDAPRVLGAGPWVGPWRVDLDAMPPARPGPPESNGSWRLYAPEDHPFAAALRQQMETRHLGSGVLVCMPEHCTEADVDLALAGAKAAIAQQPGDRFVLVQHNRGAAGIAKTLRLEAPQIRVTVVDAPFTPQTPALVLTETAATTTFVEAHYDDEGTRRVPTLRAMPVRAESTKNPLSESDVLLVTGGGKGITAECALALASVSGASLALIGRADPAADAELAANLERMAAAGVTIGYARADVTDTHAVHSAVRRLTDTLGPITGVMHGSGVNIPAALGTLTTESLHETFAPKVGGLRTVLDAVDPRRLRLLVTLGSVIGTSGLHGEAHYAAANEWLAAETAEFARSHPDCRSLCLAWSVWSGVGMGERLSVVETLNRDGIASVGVDQGIEMLHRLVTDPNAPELVVITGRTGGIDTVRYEDSLLPLLRFVERPLVRYPGRELVVETTLNPGTDLYLPDHLLDGNLLLPAVFGMEAMAQVAAALTGAETVPVIERAEFVRPIVVPPDGSTTIRIAALVADNDTVDVAIHSEETAFAAEHFRARLRYDRTPAPAGPPDQVGDALAPVDLDPMADMYGDILFQGDRFQRLRRYHRAAARHVDAELVSEPVRWFSEFLPQDLILGDPGVRDALMHGNQVCVPDATLLPVGIERLYPGGDGIAAAGGLRYCAVERSHDGDDYYYDIALRDEAGEMVERWEGLHLRAVRRRDAGGPWVPALLGSYLERTLDDMAGLDVSVCVVPSPPAGSGAEVGDVVSARRARTAVAASGALGAGVDIRYRTDGRPEVSGDRSISVSHGASVTLCVAATGAVGCDVEAVVARTDVIWQELLGPHLNLAALITGATGEDLDTAATRIWSAIECLQKAGHPAHTPLTVEPAARAGWVRFTAGALSIATFATTLRGQTGGAVFAVLAERR